MKIMFLWGVLKTLWAFLKPLLLSEVGKFLADPEVRALAMRAVEAATRVDLDNDGKYDHAVSIMIQNLRDIGLRYYRGWVGMAVEAAYRQLPEAGE